MNQINKKVAIVISPNYKDYAEKYLAECVESIKSQNFDGEMKIFITDNESSEESFAYLKKELPEAEIIRNKSNDGFAKGNNDSIKLVLEQEFEYVMLINMDAVMARDCVKKMVNAFLDSRLRGNDGREVGAVQARLMMYDNRDKINSLGNVTHYLGFGYSFGYGEEYVRLPRGFAARNDKAICYPSGAAVMYRAEVLKKVGLFDEEMWMYGEDQDLGWRLWLAGFKCVLAPEAAAYHKYEFNRSIKKYYFMDRNRILAMLKNYHWATWLLIFPAFIVMEIGLWFFASRGGWFKEKIRVYQYFLSARNWRKILVARKKAQSLRQVKDQVIVKLFSGKIWYQEIGDMKLRVANIFFNAYWQVVKIFIIW